MNNECDNLSTIYSNKMNFSTEIILKSKEKQQTWLAIFNQEMNRVQIKTSRFVPICLSCHSIESQAIVVDRHMLLPRRSHSLVRF